MRRALLVSAAFAALAAFPSAAGAATQWNGVVVAKDASRKAFVTASPSGLVRTVRAPGKAAKLRIGQRVVVRGRKLRDGTFRVAKLRALGQTTKARVRAVIVRHQPNLGRTLISAGGSVFAVRSDSLRTAASASHDDEPLPDGYDVLGEVNLDPGDEVLCVVIVENDGDLVIDDIVEVGHVDRIKLEGIFLGFADRKLEHDAPGGTTLELAIVHRGRVFVSVADGFDLPPLEPGDQIAVLAEIGPDESLWLVAVHTEHEGWYDGPGYEDEYEEPPPVEPVVVEGFLVFLGEEMIKVRRFESEETLTCSVLPGHFPDGFELEKRVRMVCKAVEDQLLLADLECLEEGSEAVKPEQAY